MSPSLPTNTMKKDKTQKKNACASCFSCFDRTPVERNELVSPSLTGDVSEFDYVVENMAISRVPKKLLEKSFPPANIRTVRDFSGYVVKKVAPNTSAGAIVCLEDSSLEMSSGSNLCENLKYNEPSRIAGPVCAPYDNRPAHRPGVFKTYHAKAEHAIDDNVIKELLRASHTSVYQDLKNAKIANFFRKTSADIHKSTLEEDVSESVQIIPSDIRETIEALKVARPLHIGSEFPPKNRRILHKSSSGTSFDKETCCNFLDFNKIDVAEKTAQTHLKVKQWPISLDKIDACSSTSDFLDNTEVNLNTSSDLQSSNKIEAASSPQGQSLKWKIIINKHKEDN